MFNDFPEFKKVLQVRALRRHHYLRKIKKQQLKLMDIRKENSPRQSGLMQRDISSRMLELKKERLIEEKMSYEELIMEFIMEKNYDPDEITLSLDRKIVKEKRELMCLHQVKKMERQIVELME